MSEENLIYLVDKSYKFSNEKAIQYFNQDEEVILFYKDFYLQSGSVQKYLFSLKTAGTLKSNCFVGVCCNVSYSYPCIIYGIIKAGLAFVPLDPMNGAEWNCQIINHLKIKLIISNRDYGFFESALLIHTLKIVNENIEFKLYETREESDADIHCMPIAYSVHTSGTTGSPKIIKVPHQTITPNITDLSQLFEITTADVIYLSSPPTFDPSIVEIFLALSNGASLLIVNDLIKKDSRNLLNVLFPPTLGRVTILQMTPSVFTQWSNDNDLNRVFGKFSKLRILAFGGEKCPSLNIIKGWNIGPNVNVYNMYGISEVSCWAAVSKLNFNCFLKSRCGQPSSDRADYEIMDSAQCFDQPMSDTLFKLTNVNKDNIGEMLIGSKKRTCLIDNESQETLNNSVVYRSTGDLFQMDKNKYYFISRKKDEIKRFGVRMNLKCIEVLAEEDTGINRAICLWFKTESDCGLVCLFIVPHMYKNYCIVSFKQKLKEKCPQGAWPDRIIVIPWVPVTKHGKTDESALHTLIIDKENLTRDPAELFKSLWLNYTQCGDIINSKGFISCGGTSFSAVQFITDLQRKTDIKYEFILNLIQDVKYGKCLEQVNCIQFLEINQEAKEASVDLEVYSSQKLKTHLNRKNEGNLLTRGNTFLWGKCEFELVVKWHYNLGKCVDASPTGVSIDGINYIVIGSHSGRVVVLNSDQGTVISEICLPDRVESKACIDPTHRQFVIGCYDGFIYMYTLESKLVWRFKTGDIVKSSPTIIDDYVLCGSYDKHVYCLNRESGQLLWKQGVGGQILTKVQNVSSIIIVATLAGCVKALQLKDGALIWSCDLRSPVFSNFLIDQNSVGIFAGVQGTLHWISIDKGQQEMEYKTRGSIFSSLVSYNENILFGTTEGWLYNVNAETASLHWKIKMDSSLVSAPLVLTPSIISEVLLPHNSVDSEEVKNECAKIFIFTVSSKGCFYLIDLKHGLNIASNFLPGEVYSSPVLQSNNIIIGCRDNNVYLISLSSVDHLRHVCNFPT